MEASAANPVLSFVAADPVLSFVASCVHALRVEFTFAAVLGVLWAVGRWAGLTGAKGSLPGARKKLLSPGSPGRTTRSKGRPDAAATALPGGVGSVDPRLLRDPGWLVPQVTQLCRLEARKALELYRAAHRAGVNLASASRDECENMFLSMVTATIRTGQADEALALLQDLRRRGPGVSAAIFGSATKLCTSKQLYSECLSIYSFAMDDLSLKVEDRSVWSCLLFCAVETKSFAICRHFWERLGACGAPSCKDYGNMIRYASAVGEWKLSLSLVQQMHRSGTEVDSVTYNTCLATCVAADRVDEARALLDEMAESGGVSDAITYNTLSKGYAKAGRISQVFELFELMRKRGVEPTQVTYGILLDSCINENQVAKAADVFELMKANGCVMNTVLYTTLIKGFARDGQVDKAMEVYEHMRSERTVPPDLITFSILIKANCDSGRLDGALRLKGAMVGLGLKADEVIFNNILGGCAKEADAELAKNTYKEMVDSGVKPSNATFSILIRLYAQCKLLDEAVDMLRREPAARGVVPEPRLYSQLVHCCLRDRHGKRATDVYRMMLDHAPPTASAHSGMLGMCVKLNMLDTAAEILAMAAEAGGRVDQADAEQVLRAAQKKRKGPCVEATAAAMEALGLRPAAA
jgi:pentatricopeptide repeat protein